VKIETITLVLLTAQPSNLTREQQRGRSMPFLFYLFTLILIAETFLATTAEEDFYLNVYGQPLQSCSSNGMALTGYTRTGYCVDQYDDQGSHHICIDLSSTNNNNNHDNFCTVTGQSDWCSSQDMPCHDDESKNSNNNGDNSCPVQNWCVCQWAFASYIQAARGCDSIQTVVCDSINQQAIVAYQQQQQQEKYASALQCIVDRCGLTDISSSSTSAYSGTWKTSSAASYSSRVGSPSTKQTVFLLMVGMAMIVASFVATYRRLCTKVHCGTNSQADDSHLLSENTTKTMI
jgi:Uncharacterized protein conserved in bacteria (DUF2237)